MPAVTPNTGSRVLLTGGNGFIGIWVFRLLLESGYTVRAAVRSLEKSKRLREYFSSHSSKIEWVVVEDMTKDGAFDGAIKDVDAIVHMASPVNPAPGIHPDEIIKPAVDITTSILKSTLNPGTKVKRIVLTSSCAAIMGAVKKPTRIFNEDDWGDEFVEVCQAKGKDAPDRSKYRASKVLAERAAWSFFNENKSKIGWELVALAPSLVMSSIGIVGTTSADTRILCSALQVVGPTLLDPKKPEDLSLSLTMWWDYITKELPDDALKSSYSTVDVRDIAAAHVVSLSNEKAGGERFIVSNGAITIQETRNFIASLKPTLYANGIFPRGKPKLENTILFDFDGEKGKQILGIRYRSNEETFADTFADFEARGWFERPLK